MRAIEINTMTDNDSDADETQWLNAISSNPAFDYLNEPSQNIYTLKDGEIIPLH